MQRPQNIKPTVYAYPSLRNPRKMAPLTTASNSVPTAIKGHLLIHTSIGETCQRIPEFDRALSPSMQERALAQVLEQQDSGHRRGPKLPAASICKGVRRPEHPCPACCHQEVSADPTPRNHRMPLRAHTHCRGASAAPLMCYTAICHSDASAVPMHPAIPCARQQRCVTYISQVLELLFPMHMHPTTVPHIGHRQVSTGPRQVGTEHNHLCLFRTDSHASLHAQLMSSILKLLQASRCGGQQPKSRKRVPQCNCGPTFGHCQHKCLCRPSENSPNEVRLSGQPCISPVHVGLT